MNKLLTESYHVGNVHIALHYVISLLTPAPDHPVGIAAERIAWELSVQTYYVIGLRHEFDGVERELKIGLPYLNKAFVDTHFYSSF